MGKRGPQPKPSALLRLAGSRKLEHRGGEPRPKNVESLAAPDFLTDEGKREWGRVTDRLRGCGMLHEIDAPLLAAYCALWAEYVKVQEMLDGRTKGLLVKGYGGRIEKLPLLEVRDTALKSLLALSARFGFTPSDRVGLNSGGKQGDDPMNALMKGKTA